MTPPYTLIVPTGYVSGTEITSSQTFNDRSFATMGLIEDTYSYTWGTGANAESINVVVGSGGTGGGGWYFYSDAGAINAGPPIADGNAIFIDNTGGGNIETFDPNKANGVNFLNFNVKDSAGTDYTTQMTDLVNHGGTIEITQNSNNVTYTLSIGMAFIDPNGGDPFFVVNAAAATQIEFTSSFVYTDPITLTITPNP
jgi:hypothetical protein